MTKRFILVFYVCILSLSALLRLSAQTPCGLAARVSDARSGEPLEGVALVTDGSNTRLVTDSTGRISIPMSCGQHGIRFQMPGYKTWFLKMDIAGETALEVLMENIATQIEEVVITSQGAQRNIETPALGVSIFSIKAVKRIVPAAGEVDIMRSLQTLPGISAVGEGSNGINIRGGAVEQNLILLDNMPIFNPSHMLGLFSMFPTDAIREIQIYKGSIPARYGGRTAGVLDVKMSEPDLENFSLRGGIGLVSSRLHLEVPIVREKLAFMTSGRFSFNQYLLRFYNNVLAGPVFEQRLPDSDPWFVDFANKLVWRPNSKNHISFIHYLSDDSYRVFDLFSIANIVPKEAVIKYGHHNMGLRWNRYFSDRLNLNTQASRARYRTNTHASDEAAGFDFKTRLNYYNIKSELAYAPSTRQRINMGVTGTGYNIQPAQLDPIEGSALAKVSLTKERAVELALFASDEYEIDSRLLAELGLRYVRYWNIGPVSLPIYAPEAPRSPGSIIDTLQIPDGGVESRFGRWEPRVALRYKLSPNSSVKIGYNRMNQFLHMLSNNTTPLPDARWKTANRYVPPAQSDLVSVGYFRDLPGQMWEWSVEAYYRRQRAVFDYLNGAELGVNPAVETQLIKGRAKAYGAELLINKKKGVMTGWLTYTYARTFQQMRGDFPALRLNDGKWFRGNVDKPHTVNLVLSFQNEKHNALSFTFVYSTGRPYTAPTGFYEAGQRFLPIYSDRNNARISDYHRLDASWTITNPSAKKRKGEASWVVSVYNLYGRKNAFSYFFDANQNVFKPYKVSVFPVPILSLSFNYKLQKNN